MENKKLKFINEKKQNVRFIFTGTKKEVNRDIKKAIKYAIKPSKFSQKQPQNLQTVDLGMNINHGLHTRGGIGLYPVPTGRILKRYAETHHLLPLSPKIKKILGETPISLKRPIQNKISIAEMKKMTYDQIVAYKKDRYMNPFGDADKDGVVNMADCKPLNKYKQDDEFDKYGNTLPGKESKIKEDQQFIPIKNAKRTVEVIEKEDGYEKWKKSDAYKKLHEGHPYDVEESRRLGKARAEELTRELQKKLKQKQED